MMNRTASLAAMATVATAIVGGSAWWAAHAESVPLSEVSHIHGITVDPEDPSRLYLATHHGVWLASPEGTAEQVSSDDNDYMGFTPHPSEKDVFYGSGHPTGGGNVGFIVSRDGAKSWEQVSPGANGPVDFHALAVSAADPAVLYGLYGDIQTSRDIGETWKVAGAPPSDVYDIAASASDPDIVFAATGTGPMVSRDAAKTWEPIGPEGQPASMIEVAPDGTVYTFVVGSGLLRRSGPTADWQPVSNGFGTQVLLHLAVDPADPARLFAVTQESKVLASTDEGKTWTALTS